VYKRVKPQVEIKPSERDAFWEKNQVSAGWGSLANHVQVFNFHFIMQQEEKQRIAMERKKSVEDRKKAEQEAKAREVREAFSQ
jgi:hypothetical protein